MFAARWQIPAPILAFGEYPDDNFHASSSGRDDGKTYFRRDAFMDDFIYQPHPLPPDPGSGYGRVSLTLPADAVNAVARYSNSSVSSALRRIAAERLGVERPSGPQLYKTVQRTNAIPAAGRSHDNSQSGNDMAGALISFVMWMIFVGIAIFVAWSSKRAV